MVRVQFPVPRSGPPARSPRLPSLAFASFLLLSGCFVPVREQIILERDYSGTSLEGDSIRVLSWNIQKKSGGRWHRDFLEIVSRYEPDLYMLQEAYLTGGLRELLGALGLGWHLSPNLMASGAGTYGGVLTASSVLPSAGTPLLSDYTEPILGTSKAALATLYRLSAGGGELLALNVHGINFTGLKRYRSQLDEIEARIAVHEGPVILSGDFNTWNTGRMRLLLEAADRLGLERVRFTAQDERHLRRFPFAHPLDHLFYRGLTLRADRSDVLETVRSSDHLPIIAEFHLPKPALPQP